MATDYTDLDSGILAFVSMRRRAKFEDIMASALAGSVAREVAVCSDQCAEIIVDGRLLALQATRLLFCDPSGCWQMGSEQS